MGDVCVCGCHPFPQVARTEYDCALPGLLPTSASMWNLSHAAKGDLVQVRVGLLAIPTWSALCFGKLLAEAFAASCVAACC